MKIFFRKRGLIFDMVMFCLALVLTSSGCNTDRQAKLHEIGGHLPDLRFSLTSDTGQLVTAQAYSGYLVLLFFGYVNCQAECPTTLFRLARIVRSLGDNASRARILFVTLDPGRDTPRALQSYVRSFDAEHALGLTGGEDDIEELAKRYRIAYRSGSKDSGEIVHSAAVYVFDLQGRARLLITPNDAIATVANDLRLLLRSPR